MGTMRKLAAVLFIASICILGVFAYDQDFDDIVIKNEWIVATSIDNFTTIAGNTQTWQEFVAKCLDVAPRKFSNISPSSMNAEDNYVITNLPDYIEENILLEDNDVYACVIAKNVYIDSGIVADGWLVLSHYSESVDEWTFYLYSFSV